MTGASDGADSRLARLVVAMNDEIEGFAGAHAGPWLLRYESAEDLAQGVASEALESADGFEYQGDKEARAWMFRIARRYLADRRRHWRTLKRGSGRVLRLDWTRSGTRGTGRAGDPAASQTGPSTFASRREQLVLAAQTMGMLLPRDRDLVGWEAEGVPIAEQAERLELSYAATVVARNRALERFRKTFELVQRGVGGG